MRQPYLPAVRGGVEEFVEHLVVDAGPGNPEHRGRECEAGVAGVLLATTDRQAFAHVPEHAQRIAAIDRTAGDEHFRPQLAAA